MPREHADYVRGQFQTPFGVMDYVLTSGDHAHVSAGGSHDPSPRILVNGIAYYTSLHLKLGQDGWFPMYEIHMSRDSADDASPAARKKATSGIGEAWTGFVGENEHLLIEAEIRNLNNEVGKAEEDIDELKKKIEKRNEDIQGLLGLEQDAYEALAKYTRKGGYPRPKDWSPTGNVPGE